MSVFNGNQFFSLPHYSNTNAGYGNMTIEMKIDGSHFIHKAFASFCAAVCWHGEGFCFYEAFSLIRNLDSM
jgi:hypothetical protein